MKLLATFPSALILAAAVLAPHAASAASVHLPPSSSSHGVMVCVDSRCTGGAGQDAGNMTSNTENYSDWAAADLKGAKLHALVNTTDDPTLPAYCTVLTCSWGSTAEALVWDTVELSTKTHQANEVVQYSFSMDGNQHRGRWAWGDSSYAIAHYYLGTNPNGLSQPAGVSLGANDTVSASFTVPADGVLTLYFLADVAVGAWDGSSADYSHTMRFDWNLPDDVTYTSASGVFMTAAVPEPANLSMLAGGLGLLGWLARRRRAEGITG